MSTKKSRALIITMTIVLLIATLTSVVYAFGVQDQYENRFTGITYFKTQAQYDNEAKTVYYDFDDNRWGNDGELQYWEIVNFTEFTNFVDLYIEAALGEDPFRKMPTVKKYLELMEECADGTMTVQGSTTRKYVFYDEYLVTEILDTFYDKTWEGKAQVVYYSNK